MVKIIAKKHAVAAKKKQAIVITAEDVLSTLKKLSEQLQAIGDEEETELCEKLHSLRESIVENYKTDFSWAIRDAAVMETILDSSPYDETLDE